jgi:tetratricopeptide (TPR) repeat protein
MPMTNASAHEDPAAAVPAPRPQVKGRTLLEHIANAAPAPVPGREPSLGLRCHACPEPANTAVARHRVVLGCAHILCGDCLTKVARANAKKRVPCPCCGKFIAETDFNPKTRPPPPSENQQMHGAKAIAAASAAPAKPAQPAPTVPAPTRAAAAAAPKEQAAAPTAAAPSAAAKPARRKPTDAERLAAAGAAAEAIAAWGEVIDGHARRPGTDKVLAGYHVKRGQLHFDQGDADAARSDADRGLKSDPSSVLCLLLRGQALHAQGKHGQAVSSLQRVLTAEPHHREAATLLAQVKKDKAEAAAVAAAAEEESQPAASATTPLSVDNDGASSSGTAAATKSSSGSKGGKKPSERIAAFIASSVEAARRKEYGLVVECLSNVFDLFPCLTREGRCHVLVRRAIAYYRLKKPAKAKQDARRAHDLNSVASTPWPLVRQLLVLLKDERTSSPPPPVSMETPPGAVEAASNDDAADPKQLDAIIEDQLTTPVPQMAQWTRTTPATAMVDIVWSEGDEEEAVFDFSPVEPKGCTSSPGLLDTACLCPNCRLKRTVGPPAPTSEALSIEGQIFAPLEHYAPMSPGLYHERELMEAKTPPAAPETMRHLYHLVSMACIMTGAIVDNPPPRRMISVIPKESVATALARYRAFFKAGVKIGAIPKWLDESAGIAVHERVVPRVHVHCANQTTGLMGLQLFAPCYLYFALSVLGDATIAASSLCILEGHSPLWTSGR